MCLHYYHGYCVHTAKRKWWKLQKYSVNVVVTFYEGNHMAILWIVRTSTEKQTFKFWQCNATKLNLSKNDHKWKMYFLFLKLDFITVGVLTVLSTTQFNITPLTHKLII